MTLVQPKNKCLSLIIISTVTHTAQGEQSSPETWWDDGRSRVGERLCSARRQLGRFSHQLGPNCTQQWGGLDFRLSGFVLAKLCSCLFIKYQTQNQKMRLLLLHSPLPIAEMQPWSQLSNTALLASNEKSFLPAHLSKMDQTSGRGEVASPRQLHCSLSPTPPTTKPGGRFVPILGTNVRWGKLTTLQMPPGDCTVSPTTHALLTLQEDFG